MRDEMRRTQATETAAILNKAVVLLPASPDVPGEEVDDPAEEGHIAAHGPRLRDTCQGFSCQRESIQ